MYFAAGALTILCTTASQAAPNEAEWNKVVDKAIEFQGVTNANGKLGPGTAQPRGDRRRVTGLLQTGESELLTMRRAPSAHIESLVNPAGAGPEATVQLQNYVTSINVT